MMVKQSDLFWGLGKAFVRQVHENAEKESHPAGTILFTEGAPATHFFTLLKGRVKLGFGASGRTVFLIDRAGESFGWSSLVDREKYSAAAECLEAATVLRFDRDAFTRAFNEYPADGLAFMKRLAAMLGQRLLKSYDFHSFSIREDSSRSDGTGQLQETTMEES
jgi:CRP-like cAMP-binding protein